MNTPREISLQDVLDLVQNSSSPAQNRALEFARQWSGPFLCYDGDVEIEGEFEVGPRPLIVWGSLRVNGAIIDSRGAEKTLLLVTGDVDVTNLITLSQVCVLGDLRVAEVIYGESGDGKDLLVVGGDTTAKAVVNDQHWFDFGGELNADYIFGHVEGVPSSGFEANELFISEVLDTEEPDPDTSSIYAATIQPERMVEKLRRGESVLRADPTTRRRELMSSLSEVSESKRVLSLEDAGLTEVPAEVFETPGLERLTLDFNEITSIPARISELTNLRYLSLDNTMIRRLPDEIGELLELRALSLRFLRLKSLPDSMANLKNLQTIYLTYSGMVEFPKCLQGLPNLSTVHFWHCEPDNLAKLEEVIQGLTTLPALANVGFFKGEISRFPENIKDLAGLKELELTDVRIGSKALDRLLTSLPNVRVRRGM